MKQNTVSIFGIFPENLDDVWSGVRRWMPSVKVAWRDNFEDSREALVVVKPNWIQEGKEDNDQDWLPLITHPDLILGVVAGVSAEVCSKGTICVCDAPHGYADFEGIVSRGDVGNRIQRLAVTCENRKIEILDLRREVQIRREGVVVDRQVVPDDPRGYVRFDLGADSLFFGFGGEGRYYGSDYDSGVVNIHHRGLVQEYLLSGTAVKCNLFVNIPRLKTHKKTGITCALKSLVGINGDKNWLPHFTQGMHGQDGDEFALRGSVQRFEGSLKRRLQRLAVRYPLIGTSVLRWARKAGMLVLGDSDIAIRSGDWQGNDTCWRMVLDLNRALLYGNPDGTMRKAGHAKPTLIVVDGVVGGEGNGPLSPDPVPSNVVVCGVNPAAVDAVCCKLMGFDPDAVPIVREAFSPHRWPIADFDLSEIEVYDDRDGKMIALDEVRPAIAGGFRPHFGWPALNHRQDELPD